MKRYKSFKMIRQIGHNAWIIGFNKSNEIHIRGTLSYMAVITQYKALNILCFYLLLTMARNVAVEHGYKRLYFSGHLATHQLSAFKQLGFSEASPADNVNNYYLEKVIA